jgi:nucleotide-binding universal stress UspA family protein
VLIGVNDRQHRPVEGPGSALPVRPETPKSSGSAQARRAAYELRFRFPLDEGRADMDQAPPRVEAVQSLVRLNEETIVFKHLLLPTDGSELAETAIREGIRFAKESNAKVTGVSVAPAFHVFTFNAPMLEDTQTEFLAESRAQAEKNLARLAKAAADEGVACETVVAISDQPYEAIIHTAENKGCDLIMMASHGRRGMQALLLGSETQKVLTHSRIPVLVFR